MSRYKFTNLKSGAWSIQDQDGYNNIAKKGWLNKYKIEVIGDIPEIPLERKSFLPPALIKMRAEAEAKLKGEVKEDPQEATEVKEKEKPGPKAKATEDSQHG